MTPKNAWLRDFDPTTKVAHISLGSCVLLDFDSRLPIGLVGRRQLTKFVEIETLEFVEARADYAHAQYVL